MDLTLRVPPFMTYPPTSPYFAGKQIVFVTNNSTKSRAEYKKKLTGMGIPAEVVGFSRPHSSPFPTTIFLVPRLPDFI